MKRALIAVAIFFAIGAGRPAFAGSFNIDFSPFNGVPGDTFGAAAGQAGVWNFIASLGVPVGLVNLAGISTPATLTVSTVSGGFGGNGASFDDPTALLYDHFLAFANEAWTVTIMGLANSTYDVYLYEPANVSVGSGAGTVNGVAFSDINGNYSGSFIEGSNFHLLESVTVSANTLTVAGTGGGFSGLAGIQLRDTQSAMGPGPAPVPEPASLALLGGGLLVIAYRYRRQRAR